MRLDGWAVFWPAAASGRPAPPDGGCTSLAEVSPSKISRCPARSPPAPTSRPGFTRRSSMKRRATSPFSPCSCSWAHVCDGSSGATLLDLPRPLRRAPLHGRDVPRRCRPPFRIDVANAAVGRLASSAAWRSDSALCRRGHEPGDAGGRAHRLGASARLAAPPEVRGAFAKFLNVVAGPPDRRISMRTFFGIGCVTILAVWMTAGCGNVTPTPGGSGGSGGGPGTAGTSGEAGTGGTAGAAGTGGTAGTAGAGGSSVVVAPCPDRTPNDGATCVREGLHCEYGDDPRGDACRTHATCASSRWQVTEPESNSCPSIDHGMCAKPAGSTCNSPGTLLRPAGRPRLSVHHLPAHRSGLHGRDDADALLQHQHDLGLPGWRAQPRHRLYGARGTGLRLLPGRRTRLHARDLDHREGLRSSALSAAGPRSRLADA